MSSYLCSSLSTISLFVILLFFSSSLAQFTPRLTPTNPNTVCNTTLYPGFCKSVLPIGGSNDIHNYGRLSIIQSLWASRRFFTLVDNYLTRRSNLSNYAIQALEDCRLLAELNMDFLLSTSNTLNTTKTLPSLQTDDLQTLLSALLTNQQTCLDGLQATSSASNVKNGLFIPLSNATKLYSVSLTLFNNGWVHQNKTGKFGLGRKLLFSNMEVGRHSRLPWRMWNHNQKIFESVNMRKLLDIKKTVESVLVSKIVVVNPDGSGNFTTINDAVSAAPNNTDAKRGYFLIYIVGGVYNEYVSISKKKKNLMMVGDGINQTVITGNRSVGDGWTTFNSATFAVVGQGFVAINITFRNTAGPIKNQAVAVRNGADLSTFYSCSFEGYQDTLYTHSLRQFYRECDIYGTVDFIFGNSAVVFQNCNIYARLPKQGQFNALTAQGRTDPNQNTGTSIQNCIIKAASDLASSNGTTKTYLGRPWKEYSRTIYMQSFIDNVIDESGWHEWSGDFALSTLYYGEYNNTGPGSNTSARVTWPGYNVMSTTDATNFTVSNFILGDNWLSTSGVPYN